MSAALARGTSAAAGDSDYKDGFDHYFRRKHNLHAACAPEQSCVALLVDPVRSRLLGPRYPSSDGGEAAPAAWSVQYSEASMLSAVRFKSCANSAAHVKSDRSPCAFTAKDPVVEEQEEEVVLTTSFALRLQRALLGDTSKIVVFTVVDATRKTAIPEFLAGLDGAVPLIVVTDADAKREAQRSSASWVEYDPVKKHHEDDAFLTRAMRTGGLQRGSCEVGVTGLGVRSLDPLWRLGNCVEHYQEESSSRVGFAARFALRAASRHAALWSTVENLLIMGVERFIYVDTATFWAHPRGLFNLLDAASGDALHVGVRQGADPRNEFAPGRAGKKPMRANIVGGTPTVAVVAHNSKQHKKALKLSKLLSGASRSLLETTLRASERRDSESGGWNASTDTELGAIAAAADADSLLRCVALYVQLGVGRGLISERVVFGDDPEHGAAWGCSSSHPAHVAARSALIRAMIYAEPQTDITGSIGLFDAESVVSAEHPTLHPATLAVHIRTGDDDHAPAYETKVPGSRGSGDATGAYHGVVSLAKELGLWPGADCYYCTGRFLAMEDHPAALLPPDFHSSERNAVLALNLVALGYFTGRTVILPQALLYERFFYLHEWVDVKSYAASLGVQFRESRFLNDPRLDQPMSTAHVAIRPDGLVGVRKGSEEKWYHGFNNKRLLWAVANESPLAASADILYVDLDAPITSALLFPERICFSRTPAHRKGRGCAVDPKMHGATWLAEIHEQGGWCVNERNSLRRFNLLAASDDCHARRVEDARRARHAHLSRSTREHE